MRSVKIFGYVKGAMFEHLEGGWCCKLNTYGIRGKFHAVSKNKRFWDNI